MKKIYFTILLLISFVMAGFSQSPCITDQIYQQQLKNNPGLKDAETKFNKNVRQQPLLNKASVKIIPVVFHVLHNNGAENISKEQIEDQIRILNLDFRRQNLDTNKTRSIFKGMAVDCEIEFRLATKDPYGNCSEGINRIETLQTENATDEIKKVYGWPSDRYYNIWVVKSINSATSTIGVIAGYAHFPWSGLSLLDGVVIRADYVGSIGTAAVNRSRGRVLTHETGHWLGLFHTFQDSCDGGDKVDDTPPVLKPNFNICLPSTLNSCVDTLNDLPDQYENYMDYSDGVCQNMYTIGQKARMMETLAGIRSGLITNANLIKTGVLNPVSVGLCKPEALFGTQGVKMVCEGANLAFKDLSYNYSGSITYNWIFDGGTPATSTVANPTVTYAEPGWKKITMIAGNANGSDTFTQMKYIKVFPKAVVGNSFNQGFEVEAIGDVYWDFSTTEATGWALSNIAYGGSRSIYVKNSEERGGNEYSMVTNQVNISDASKPFSFYYAYTPRQIPVAGQNPKITNDALNVYASFNCGATWTLLWKAAGTNLMTTTGVSLNRFLEFQPKSSDLWKNKTISLSNISAANLKNIMFKFVFESAGGGHMYIDNIGLGGFSGVSQLSKDNLKVYPNPANTTLNINLTSVLSGNSSIAITDMAGKQVLQTNSNSFPYNLDISSVNNGIYLLSVETENGARLVQRFQVLR